MEKDEGKKVIRILWAVCVIPLIIGMGSGQKTGQEDSPLKEVCTQRKKKRRHWVYTTKPNP